MMLIVPSIEFSIGAIAMFSGSASIALTTSYKFDLGIYSVISSSLYLSAAICENVPNGPK